MKADSPPLSQTPGTEGSAPNCLRCGHFKTTWEPSFPRSCTLFGIKCRNLPSVEVFLSTGKHCFAYQERNPVKNDD